MNVFIYLFLWKNKEEMIKTNEDTVSFVQNNRCTDRFPDRILQKEKKNKNNNNKVSVRESEKYLTFFMYVM